MKKAISKIIVGFLLFMFIGIKYDVEFHEPDFFFKHRPNLQIEYYSPIGNSDLTLNDLSGKNKEQEIIYREFVGNYYDRSFLNNISFLLVPLMSLFILSGFLQLFKIIKSSDSLKNFGFGYISILIILFVVFCIYWNLHINGLVMVIVYWVFSLLGIVLINREIKRDTI